MSKQQMFHVSQDALIASLIDSLSSIVFSEDIEEKEMYLKALEFKLSILIPDSLDTDKNKFIYMIVLLISSYVDLEDIEIKAMQKLKLIGIDIATKLNMRMYKHNEDDLKEFVSLFIIPSLINMGIDLELEFAEMDGLRTQIQMSETI